MKNKKSMFLTVIIVIALVIIGMILLNKREEDNLTVTLYHTGKDLEFDFEKSSYKYNKIELTPEQQKKIIKFYNRTNTKSKQGVELAIIGTVKLEFSDGNIIAIDDNNDSYGYINGEYCIRLSKGFKEYILRIID